ncbi:hypothetical protein [Burkholderia sp. S171]|nr:hypothetical protein [Burkholderia sp. S171]
MGLKTRIMLLVFVMTFVGCIALGVSTFKWQGIDLTLASRGAIANAHPR